MTNSGGRFKLSGKPIIVETDWAGMTFGEQVRHLEVEGYVVLPGMLAAEQIQQLHAELKSIPTESPDYTDKKKGHSDIQWAGGAITELIAHSPMIAWLRRLFGDPPVLMTYDYARSEPDCPAINLHSDGQPWGSKIFGAEQSCPRLVRVLYYLQDLTTERAPFRVVPRSHLSFHNHANPYLRYREHPEEVMVTCAVGDACLINQNVFHGNYPNRTDRAREMLGLAYRPTWAGPFEPVPPWSEEKLAGVSEEVRAVMSDRSRRIWRPDAGNVQPDMPSKAAGIDPSRWDLA